MRTLLHKSDFIKKIKKPHIKTIVDNLDNLSIDNINNLNESKWIKDQLIYIKNNNGKSQSEMVNHLTNLLIKSHVHQDQILYDVYQWNTTSKFIKSIKSLELEFKNNDYIMFKEYDTNIGELLNDNVYIKVDISTYFSIKKYCKYINKLTIIQYTKLINDKYI